MAQEKPISPENGHLLNKIEFSFGHSNKHKEFIKLTFKPSYHELIDNNNNKGFEFGSEINFFSTELNYYTKNNKISAEKIDFIRIKSLAIHDYFFKPISFSILFGMNNLYNDFKILTLNTNGGITLGNEKISTFFLVGQNANYGENFNKNINAGFNTNLGIFINFDYLKTIVDFKTNNFIKTKYNYNQFTIDGNLNISKNKTINIKYDKYFYKKFKNTENFSIGFKFLF